MVDLPSLVQAAHGGEIVGDLSRQFGLSAEQAQAAIDALTPVVAHGLQNLMQSDQGAKEVVGALNDPAHQAAYADAGAAQTSEAGAALLERIFGAQGVQDIVGHVAAETGMDANVLQALAPVVASLVAGGVAKAVNEGALPAPAAGQQAPASGASQGIGLSHAIGDLINPVFNAMFAALLKQKPQAASEAAPAAAAAGPDLSALRALFNSSQASEALQALLGQVFANRPQA
jgi:hypothetical protein